jgi:pilus assembly protein Flp/PilA
MTRFVKRLLTDCSGATAIEYSLMAALIALATVVAVRNVGTNVLSTKFNVVANATH